MVRLDEHHRREIERLVEEAELRELEELAALLMGLFVVGCSPPEMIRTAWADRALRTPPP